MSVLLRLPSLLCVSLVLLAAGCSDDKSSERACRTGDSLACTCPDGTASTQPCVQGTYQDCACGQPPADMTGDSTPDTSNDVTTDQGDIPSDTDITSDMGDVSGDTPADVPADTPADMPGDMTMDTDTMDMDMTPDLCPVTARCASRVVETCDPMTGNFSESQLCMPNERCLNGTCAELPPQYGDPCSDTPGMQACTAAGLGCGGFGIIPSCVHPNAPGMDGGECWQFMDCTMNSLCTLDGHCSPGTAGSACRGDADCNMGLTCGMSGQCE